MIDVRCVVRWSDAYSEDVHNSPSDSQPDMQCLADDAQLDFYETNCHWRACGLEFDTQDDLVRVSTLSSALTGLGSRRPLYYSSMYHSTVDRVCQTL